MIVITERQEVERSGEHEGGRFRINETAKSFEILSSALYSDKIKAIVRELSCNAYDSHVAAGCPQKPIDVKLPNILDSRFYVRDYGLGMSHEDVMTLYTTYFESTKTQSDDFIGQLGLGSKSPFSYASTFTVESRFNGELRIYTCYKDEDGFPAINLMAVSSTDEGNGITVSLPCRTGDHDKFATAARKALMYFTPVPNFVDSTSFVPYALVHTVSGSNWKLRDTDYYASMSGAHVVQGFVAYPVDSEQLAEAGLSDTAADLCLTDIDVFVRIGLVEVAPSREALSYDRRTIANLIAEFTTIAAEIRQSFQDAFDKCKTPWEMALLFSKYFNGKDKMSQLFRKMHAYDPFTWNGDYATHTINAQSGTIQSFAIHRMTTTKAKTRNTLKTANAWTPWSRQAQSQLDPDRLFMTLPVSADTFVVVNDTKKAYHRGTIRDYVAKLRLSRTDAYVYLFEPVNPKVGINQIEIDQLFDQLGVPSFVLLSTLPKPASAARTAQYFAKRAKEQKMVWMGFTKRRKNSWSSAEVSHTVFSAKTWDLEEVDLSAGGVYVQTSKFKLVGCGFDSTELDDLISLAKALELVDSDFVLYGFSTKDLQQAKQAGGKWVELKDYIHQQALAFDLETKRVERTTSNAILSAIPATIVNWSDAEWQIYDNQTADGQFKETITELRTTAVQCQANPVSERTRTWIQSLTQIIGSLPSSARVDSSKATSLAQAWRDTLASYEMLKFINWSSHVDNQPIIQYVNLIESTKVAQ